jgi:hypothetical protein
VYGNPPRFHACIPPQPKQTRSQLIIQARQGYWGMWIRPEGMSEYDELTRDHLIAAWWANSDAWVPLEADPCRECSHYIPRCIICGDEARYFISSDKVIQEVALCDECGPALENEDRWEMGVYACCDGCLCDSWK